MRVLLICCIYSIINIVSAQKNTVFIEARGNGGWASINYERQLTKAPRMNLRFGIGFTQDNLVEPNQLLSIINSVHYLIDLKKGNYLDLSIGISWFDATEMGPENGVYQFFTGVGFRKDFKNKWFYRGHISPYIWTLTNSKKLPDSNAGESGGIPFFYYPSRTRFYRYGHEDAWLGFSVGLRF